MHKNTFSMELPATEATFYAIFDAGPDVLLIVDESGIIVMASKHIKHLLGYTSNEIVGMQVESLMPMRYRENHPKLRNHYGEAPSARLMGQHREIKALRKDGSECDVEIGLNQFVTGQGSFVVCSIRDISERIKIEKSLREQEEKLLHLFELSPLGIAMTDMKGRFLTVNEAFQQIFGYSEDDLNTLNYWDLSFRKFEVDEERQIESLLHTGRYGPYEKEYMRKDGSVVPVRLNAVLSTAHDGQPYIWSIVEDITLSKQAEDKIRELAYFDQLTGLPNRTLMYDRLKHALVASLRTDMYGGVLLIDLDNFRAINDTWGHGAGDLFLVEIAERLKLCIRKDDTVSRLGGDEFIIILANLSSEESSAAAHVNFIAKKLLAAVKQKFFLGQDWYQCTASIGATLFSNSAAANEDILKQVDLALYRAKGAGRGVIRFYDPDMEASVLARTSMERDLLKALDHKQLMLYYQAQVTDKLGILGAEVLTRWQHPEKGMIPPVEFIPVAEETGLIVQLGKWVLETACSQLAAWATDPIMSRVSLAVNVSVRQFSQPDFVDLVLSILDSTGVNPVRLKLELTESVLASDAKEIAEKMNALKKVGVCFSLDDFGTGYSSLAYLKRLPLDQLKIDQSFVREVLSDPNDAAIAKTVVALAHSLGLDVIAEGVETEAQKVFLSGAGCNSYQGYLFSKPLPVEDFVQLVKSEKLS